MGITDKGPFVYPDVTVTCDDRYGQRPVSHGSEVLSLSLLVEVISPGTEVVTVPGTMLAERSRSQNPANMSPSTPLRGRLPEVYDRGGKFTLYRRLESLQEYVLVGSEARTVEVFRRDEAGGWRFIPYGEGADIELASLELTVSMDDIYEDVVFETSEP